uniref:uncharacterized protein LOC101307874 n=1 Tax=Fragaria vesca subsp. vesca TaxID=101020 RepID=UPI0005C888EB|nr:PREDICTED: uncharacterized protein LOC101307874 [Fragaria vesca subsp. vesca]
MCPRNAYINILKLKAFPFSLEDRAKSWLIDLPAGHIDSWEKMMSEFLTKCFPASKITVMRKQITSIQQGPEETFCAYYERFKALVAACPSHRFKENNLLQYFYEELSSLERQLLNAASGGSFLDKTPREAWALLDNRALNDQQYASALASSRKVNEVKSSTTLESKIDALLAHLVLGKNQEVKACGVCSNQGHPTDQCPQLSEKGGWETLNAIGQQRGPFPRPQGFFQKPQVPQNFASTSNSNNATPSYDKMPEALFQGQQNLTNSTQALVQGQTNNTKDIAELKNQVGKIVDFMGKFSESGKLPTSTVPNPNSNFESAKIVATGSGRVFNEVPKKVHKKAQVA